MTQERTTGTVVISAIVGIAVACVAHGWYAAGAGLVAWLVVFTVLVHVFTGGEK